MSQALPYIFTGFSPNESRNEFKCALAWLINPLRWRQWRTPRGCYVEKAEEWLRNFYQAPYALTLDSGRSALFLILESLGIQSGDEVIVQAYTCVVVTNAIKQTGAIPIYVDIKNNFTIDQQLLVEKISPRTKAVIVQHTFGYPADLTAINELAQKHQFYVIEDAAHTIGGTKSPQLLGTAADATIISFGSDKVVSAVRGGAIITNNTALGKTLEKKISTLPPMPWSLLMPHMLHVPFFYLGKKWYHRQVGKWLLGFISWVGLINRIIYPYEKQGRTSSHFPAQFSNCLAALVLPQLLQISADNRLRQLQAKKYFEKIHHPHVFFPPVEVESALLRFPLLVSNPDAWRRAAVQARIQLGDWYSTVVAPTDIAADVSGYVPGSCPLAEKLASQTVNLPLGPQLSTSDQTRVINFINAAAL